MKKIIALLLVFVMMFALCGCGKSEAVISVEKQIDSISEVVLPDEEGKIKAVRAAYDVLTDEEKETVENYAVLVECEYKNDLAFLEKSLKDMTAKSETVIDMYGKISSAAASGAYNIGNSWGKVQDYFDCIMAVEADTTLESWKKNYSRLDDAAYMDLFQLGAAVYGENMLFDFSFYSDFYDIRDAFYDEGAFSITEEDLKVVFARAYEYKSDYMSLVLEDELAYKAYADLRSKYGDTHKEQLDAIEGWYFAVSEGVNYVLNPSGSLSTVVSGWGDKANAIEMAERAYNLK